MGAGDGGEAVALTGGRKVSIDEFLDSIFTSSENESAKRLVMIAYDGHELGGWCREAIRDRLIALLPSRFYVGQWVRFSKQGMHQFGCTTRGPLVGIVTRIKETEIGRYLTVERKGMKKPQRFHESNWEPVVVGEVPPDAICEQLVAAYQAGQKDAALALADRIMELRGGTLATVGAGAGGEAVT